MRSRSITVRLPSPEETIAPVTIFDGEGHVVRVVPATEFRRPEPVPGGHWRERRSRFPRPVAVNTAPEDVVK